MAGRRGRMCIVLTVTVATIGCGARKTPVVYEDERVRSAPSGEVDRDLRECMRRGDQYAAGHPLATSDVAADTVTGAAVGAAAGAAGGAIRGDAGRSAAAGAAGGAAGGLVHGLFRAMRRRGPDSSYAEVVNRCLREKGYEPIGWK